MNRASSDTSNYAPKKVLGALKNESGTHVLYIIKDGRPLLKKRENKMVVEIKYATPDTITGIPVIRKGKTRINTKFINEEIYNLLKNNDKIIIQIKK